MNNQYQTELSIWMPRLSGSAFKCLFCIYLELLTLGAAEVIIPRSRFVEAAGLSKSTVQDALAELVRVRAVRRRPTKGGAFAYAAGEGVEINPAENQPGGKSAGRDLRSGKPKDVFPRLLWHWGKMFDDQKVAELKFATEVIADLLEDYSYRELLQSLRGLGTTGNFDLIFDLTNSAKMNATVRQGQFLYFNWRENKGDNR